MLRDLEEFAFRTADPKLGGARLTARRAAEAIRKDLLLDPIDG